MIKRVGEVPVPLSPSQPLTGDKRHHLNVVSTAYCISNNSTEHYGKHYQILTQCFFFYFASNTKCFITNHNHIPLQSAIPC